MHFDLSKPQKLLQQSVRDFCKREVPVARVRELMETDSAMSEGLWSDMADQGWIGLHVGEEFGGLGLGLVELSVVAEELGRACVPGPWLATNWAATLLEAVGGPLAGELLPAVAAGSARVAVAALEPRGTWDFRIETLETKLSADEGTLDGRKHLVIDAAGADHLLCVAGHGEDLSLVMILGAADGVRLTATPGIDLTRRVYECVFEGVSVSPEQLLARGDTARHAFETGREVATVAVCAEMLGILQWLLETTVEYAKTRKQFDRPIGSFQVVQQMCADMLLMTESARSAVWYAAWAVQADQSDARRAVAVAKAYVSDAVRRVGNLAIQTHGGIGFTWEHDLHLYYKRAKADEYLFGDATFHRERLAAEVFGE